MLEDKRKNVLQKAGKLSQACRSVVGGHDINGFLIAPANIRNISYLLEKLEKALDEYDQAILETVE